MAQTDTQSRKWQITINNPVEKGYTHDFIKSVLSDMRSLIYWCMADEIGENGTYHTHIFLQSRGGTKFSTLKKRFEGAHFEMAKGTSQQNMEYVSKTGKWKDNKKSETSVSGTFEEFGEMPVERQGRRNDLDDLYSMIKDGYSDYQILEVMPESLIHLDKMERIRQTFRYEQYKEVFRNVSCHYIYGTTGSGKTRSVVEHFGYTNLYRVTDYMHPFDSYKGQDVMVFEEFRSGIPFSEMLSYLDGHPVELPCRYFNKNASYTKVYILTNIPLSQQYTGIQMDKPDDWMAFLRRINTVTQVFPTGSHTQKIEFTPDGFYRMLDCEVSPFD